MAAHELDLVVRHVPERPRTAVRARAGGCGPSRGCITDQPAAVSTSAAVAPAGPGADDRRRRNRSGTSADLLVGVAARLHVAGNPIARHPARSRLPPYSGAPYTPSHACSYSSCLTRGCASSARVLLVARRPSRKSSPERGDPVAVQLLPTADRPVPLRVAGSPRDPSMRVRHASSSTRDNGRNWSNEASPPKRPENGPPAQMRGGSKANAPSVRSMYSATPGRRATGERVVRRQQPIGDAGDDRTFVRREEPRHEALASQAGSHWRHLTRDDPARRGTASLNGDGDDPRSPQPRPRMWEPIQILRRWQPALQDGVLIAGGTLPADSVAGRVLRRPLSP